LNEKEIKAKYKKLHDEATEGYYSGASGWTKEEFNVIHAQIWNDMESELRAGDFLPPPGPDYKALYAGAATDKAKLEVIAKKLELI
jgi:hypothetical protein